VPQTSFAVFFLRRVQVYDPNSLYAQTAYVQAGYDLSSLSSGVQAGGQLIVVGRLCAFVTMLLLLLHNASAVYFLLR